MRIGLFLSASLLAVTIATAQDNNNTEQQFREFKNEIITQLNRNRVAYNEDLKQRTDQIRKVQQELVVTSDYVGVLENRLSKIENAYAQQGKQKIILESKVKLLEIKVQLLKTALIKELTTRQTADRQIIETVTAELQSAISGITAAPTTARAIDTGTEPNHRVYTVTAGDTLSAIAIAFSTKVDALKALNNLDADVIFVGQKLKITETAP
jgi:LysM repeat protein